MEVIFHKIYCENCSLPKLSSTHTSGKKRKQAKTINSNMKKYRILLVFAKSGATKTLSYQWGWPKYFQENPLFDCIPINLLDKRILSYKRSLFNIRFRRYDAAVLLHSTFSNSCHLGGQLLDTLGNAKQPKIYFIGNEYKLLPEKMRFCEQLGISLLITQCNSPEVIKLYHDRLHCRVAEIPNTGLDTNLFKAQIPSEDRKIDIGYRSFEEPIYFGVSERLKISEYFLKEGTRYGLKLDISLNPEDRFDQAGWAEFLNQCKGQLGTESGTDYFELDDSTRQKVIEHLKVNPDATDEEIFERYLKKYPDPVPLRIISGRNIEAAGTKTVQILFEGRYSGYFQPDLHYIPLKKDFSNFDEVIAKFKDKEFCRQLTENAYEMATGEFTYEKLLERFYNELKKIL